MKTCETCIHELNGKCFVNYLAWDKQLERGGSSVIYRNERGEEKYLQKCGRYQFNPEESKERERKNAVFMQSLWETAG